MAISRIGAGFAARDGAGKLVDALVEGGDAGHVERDVGKIAGFAAQQRDDAFDRDFDIQRRALLARLGIELEQPPPGFDLAGFGSCTPTMPARPHAMPQRPIAVSNMVYPRPVIRHQPRNDHNTVIKPRIWNLEVKDGASG